MQQDAVGKKILRLINGGLLTSKSRKSRSLFQPKKQNRTPSLSWNNLDIPAFLLEQMRFLLAVINDPNNAGAESCQLALKSLYNELKKL